MQETFKFNFDVSYGEYAGSLFRHFLKSKYLRFFILFLVGLILLMTLLGLATSSEMNFLESMLSSMLPILVISVFAPIPFLFSLPLFTSAVLIFLKILKLSSTTGD